MIETNADPSNSYFTSTPFGDQVSWISGVIVADGDADFQPFGSGFLATPNLAFTARHVVDEICQYFAGENAGPDTKIYNLTGEMPFGAQLATADTSGNLVKWDIIDYHYTPTLDIVGLSIERADGCAGNWPRILPRFEVQPPMIGQSITAFGYPRTKVRQLMDGEFKVRLSPLTAYGIVREMHPKGRDRSMLPFPCFRTDARMDAGMSGGPVFNDSGRICGVVTSSLPYDPAVPTVSYASMFFPALGIHFNEKKGQNAPKTRFLRNEAETGAMNVSNLAWMTVTPSSGSAGKVSYFGPPICTH
jgi:hypothetical protein